MHRAVGVGAIFQAAGLCIAISGVGCNRSAPEPPDILIITIDTLRYDHLGFAGHPTLATPAIDSLAAAGVAFNNAVCQVPLTLPSHCSIFTGLYPHRHGVRLNEHYLDAEGPASLPETLAEAGYRTAAFVSGFPLDSSFGLARGFETYDDALTSPSELDLPADHRHRAERRAGETVAAVLRWLAGAPANPMFLWVHFYDPHDPYEPPAGFPAGYAGEIAYVDREVGRLLAAVGQARGDRPRVTVLTADHGEGLGDHGEPTHGLYIYDSTMRVPLVVTGPGVAGGRRIDEQVQTVDIAPTVLELAAVGTPAVFDGRSLVSHLVDGGRRTGQLADANHTQTAAYLESRYATVMGWSPLRAVRTGAFKYIDAPRPELYDLRADPEERNDIAANQAEVAERMIDQLLVLAQGERQPDREATPDAVAQLRALGYITGGRSPAGATAASSDAELVDPKDRAHIAALIARAEGMLLARRTTEGIALLKRVVDEDPQNTFVATRIGLLYKQDGAWDASAEWLGLALAIDPAHVEAAYQLADTHYRAGRADSAASYFQRAIELEPRRVAAHTNLGVCLMRLGDTEGARRAVQRAIDLAPDQAAPRASLGAIELALGHHERALELLETARDLDPQRFRYRYELGTIYLGRGDTGAAAGEFGQVRGRKRPLALIELAAMAVGAGRLDEAGNHASEAVRLGGAPVKERLRTDRRFEALRNTPEGSKLLGGS